MRMLMNNFDNVAPMQFILTTTGRSLYSSKIRPIQFVEGEVIDYTDYDEEEITYSGEFRLYFTGWDVQDEGYIYTDEDFLTLLRTHFNTLGITNDIWYSEFGMQGETYISFDVDGEFMKSFKKYAEGLKNGSTTNP